MSQKTTYLAGGLAVALAGVTSAMAATPTIAQLQPGHRVLIVSGPAGASELRTQEAELAAWRREGQDRDVAAVIVDGSKVEGASDTAAAIRARYALPAGAFAVALIGKDGHVALRATEPVAGAQLQQTIDAMPMRRAGQR